MQPTIATYVQYPSFGTRIAGYTLPWRIREAQEPIPTPAAMMPEFEQQFDELIDLLCWSAKDGDHEGRDERYASLRAWFLRNYEPLRPHLLNHLVAYPDDVLPARPGQPSPRDAFESLFLPRDVDSIIHSENVICRIIRARNAVDSLRAEMDSLFRF